MEDGGRVRQTDREGMARAAEASYDADRVRSSFGDGNYGVFCHCRNYQPKGRERSFDMSDYQSCDSCLYQRTDQRCGLAQQTLQ